MNREQRRASKSNGRKMMKGGWNDFEDWTQKAVESFPPYGLFRFFKNNIYTVQHFKNDSDWGVIDHLMCRRNDESAVHSWQELQLIKNTLMGENRTAIEVYPSKQELVDDANIYHLWVLPEHFRLPFTLKKNL